MKTLYHSVTLTLYNHRALIL